MLDSGVITRSLQRAGMRCADPAPLVYARLFADHPEMEPLFVRDRDGSVRGEMLARTFETLLDFIDQRAYAARMIQCEVITHDGYGVPPKVFGVFFGVVAATLRDILGAEWTGEDEAAWAGLLAALDWYVTHPDQSAT